MCKRVLALLSSLAVVTALLPLASASGSTPKGQDASEVVKIGILTPVESAGVSNPDDPDAFQAAIAWFNKRGGAGTNHARIRGIVCDTRSDPNREVECAREMVEEGVVATIADLTFNNPAPVVSVFEEAQIPRIGSSAANPADFGSDISFPLSAGPVGEYVGAASALSDRGDTTVALARTDAPTGGAFRGFLTPPLQEAGIEIVGEVEIATGSTDYAPYVAAVQDSGADAVLVAVAEQPGAQFVAAMAQLNAEFRLSGLTPTFSLEALRENESVTRGAVLASSFPYPSLNNAKRFPGLKSYFAAMKASGKDNLQPRRLKPSNIRVWMGMLGFVGATANLDSITKETVLQALETEQDIDMDGLIQPWTPSTPGYSIFTAISNHFVYPSTFNGTNVVTPKTSIDITQYFAS
jgi:ABC-type branched-subunit amino acid transport system substrate-binding protein